MYKYVLICMRSYPGVSVLACFGHFLHINPPQLRSPLLRLKREAWHSARTRPMVPVPCGALMLGVQSHLVADCCIKPHCFQPVKGKTNWFCCWVLWFFSYSAFMDECKLRRYMKVPSSISTVLSYSIFAHMHIIINLPSTIPHNPKWRYIDHSDQAWQRHWAWNLIISQTNCWWWFKNPLPNHSF